MTDNRSPRLNWTPEGPRSGRFGDVYFSREDGLAESRAVFLAGCGLPGAWAGRERFTVAELGFGTGLNIVALLDLWRRERPDGGRLHVFSIEGYPLSRGEAERALSAWPELADATSALLAVWPEPTPGFHRLDLPAFDCTLDLAFGDAQWALERWSGAADAWFLDGFAPSTNPAMWSDGVLDRIAALSAPDARIATFTVAGAVRRGLAARGFAVEKRPGHGRKRERLEARGTRPAAASGTPSVAVVGAGVAGAALVHAFRTLGTEPVVVEREAPGAGASGFPAALVTPRLDVGDTAIAALFAQALARAGALYGATPGAVLAREVLQLEQAPRDARRYARVAEQEIWPAGAMTVLGPADCAVRLGEPVEAGGLLMRDAHVVRGEAVLEAWLSGARLLRRTVAGLERAGSGWRLTDPAGEVIVEADVVALAAGWGAADLMPALQLSPVGGQADWVKDATAPPAAWGGYVAPAADGLLYGATHERGRADLRPSDAGSRANLATLAARLPRLAESVAARGPSARRTAVRAVTPDRLPLAGRLDDGLFVLGGLGSRGFCAAPLLSEHVAAIAVGAPSPLPLDLAVRVAPGRFKPGPGLAQRTFTAEV